MFPSNDGGLRNFIREVVKVKKNLLTGIAKDVPGLENRIYIFSFSGREGIRYEPDLSIISPKILKMSWGDRLRTVGIDFAKEAVSVLQE